MPGNTVSGDTVYTVGHGMRPFDAIVADLRSHGVNLIADVRSVPWSRHNPEMTRPRLETSAREIDMGYRWLGDRLGGRPEDPTLWRGHMPDWEAIAADDRFGAGMVELEGLLGAGTVVLMCSESSPDLCHRSGLIAPSLIARGHDITHILSDGSAVPHHPTLDLGRHQ